MCVLTRRHLAERLQWRHLRRATRRTVLFSDEYLFLLSRVDGRTCLQTLRRYACNTSTLVVAGIRHGGLTARVHVAGSTDGHPIPRRDPAASRHSARERQRWNVFSTTYQPTYCCTVSVALQRPDVTLAGFKPNRKERKCFI